MSGITQLFLGSTPAGPEGPPGRANIDYVISSNSADLTVTCSSLPGYVAGLSNINITIASGVYVYASSNTTIGLTVGGAASNDVVRIINQGFIVGRGGNGANVGPGMGYSAGAPGSGGGQALKLNSPGITIDNTNPAAYIAGGGGGGGSGKYTVNFGQNPGIGTQNGGGGGGGAGGGAGGAGGSMRVSPQPGTPVAADPQGGAGGGLGQTGANGQRSYSSSTGPSSMTPDAGAGGGGAGGGAGGSSFKTPGFLSPGHAAAYTGGGGGGYILPGTGGAGNAGGLGNTQGTPGAGGSANGVGGTATAGSHSSQSGGGGGGGWGAAGGSGNPAGGGGAGLGGAGGFAVEKAPGFTGPTWVNGDLAREYGQVRA